MDTSLLPPIPADWDEGLGVAVDYMNAITDAIVNHPRSLQKAIGPSEIGQPCARKIAYTLLEQPERTDLPPNWRATAGTGIHAWLEDAFDRANLTWNEAHGNQGVERWLIEEKVTVGQHLDGTPITGSCDLYDRLTATVIDHKTTSQARLKKYRSSRDPGDTYRTQAHLYGLGWTRQGLPVNTVAICFLPRDGNLADAYWWSEPWDPVIAGQALQRLHGIEAALTAAGKQALAAIPTADQFCNTCEFFRRGSTDLGAGCPGDPATHARAEADTTNQLDGLLPVGQ